MNQSLINVQPDNQLAMQVGGWGIEITFNVGYKRIYIYLKDLSLYEKHSNDNYSKHHYKPDT